MIIDLDDACKKMKEYDSIIESCKKELKAGIFNFPRTRKRCLEEMKNAIENNYNLYIQVFGEIQKKPYGEELDIKDLRGRS